MINDVIIAFENQLLIAMNAYLIEKEFFQNANGIKYYCARPATNKVALHFSSQHVEDLLLNFLSCTTNPKPCLSGYMDLRLKREGCDRYSTMHYYFHICTGDYEIISANTYEMSVHNISSLVKQKYRWY